MLQPACAEKLRAGQQKRAETQPAQPGKLRLCLSHSISLPEGLQGSLCLSQTTRDALSTIRHSS